MLGSSTSTFQSSLFDLTVLNLSYGQFSRPLDSKGVLGPSKTGITANTIAVVTKDGSAQPVSKGRGHRLYLQSVQHGHRPIKASPNSSSILTFLCALRVALTPYINIRR